jgi:hypothetical protein
MTDLNHTAAELNEIDLAQRAMAEFEAPEADPTEADPAEAELADLPRDTRVRIIGGQHAGSVGWVVSDGILFIQGLGACYVSRTEYVTYTECPLHGEGCEAWA